MATVNAKESQSVDVPQDLKKSNGQLDFGKMLETSLSGERDLEQVVYGTSSTPASPEASSPGNFRPSPLEELEREAGAEDGEEETAEGQAASSESEDSESETSSLSELLDSDDQQETAESVDIETIVVRGEDGRKQKLKIDYSDKQATKQAHIRAAGMRKFQAERDQVRKSHQEVSEKLDSLEADLGKLDQAWQAEGVKGLVKLLSQGDEDAWTKAIEDELKEREYLANLSPDEKLKLEMQQREQRYMAELESERSKRSEFEKKIQEREEQAALQSLESKLHPAFDRYRFSGKLGDPVAEHKLDKSIWVDVTEALSEYPDDAEITQAVVDREFRKAAASLKKVIAKQSEKTVKTTLGKKKAEASQRAAVAAKKGLTGSADKRKFAKDMRSGNLSDAFAALMQGKIKL